MQQEVRGIIEAQVTDRASAIEQIERGWAAQKRSPTAEEVEGWLREGRQ